MCSLQTPKLWPPWHHHCCFSGFKGLIYPTVVDWTACAPLNPGKSRKTHLKTAFCKHFDAGPHKLISPTLHCAAYYHMCKCVCVCVWLSQRPALPNKPVVLADELFKHKMRAACTACLGIWKQIWYLAWAPLFSHINRRPCLLDIKRNRWELRMQSYDMLCNAMQAWPVLILNANSVVLFSCYAKRPWLAAVWMVCECVRVCGLGWRSPESLKRPCGRTQLSQLSIHEY